MRYGTMIILLSILSITLLIISQAKVYAQDQEGPVVIPIYPMRDQTIQDTLPLIQAEYSDVDGVDKNSIQIMVDGLGVQESESTHITESNFSYQTMKDFPLVDGNHTVYVYIEDDLGNPTEFKWWFHVNTTVNETAGEGITLRDAITVFLIVTAVIMVGLLFFTIYLKITRGFNVRKYFKRHPIPKTAYVVIIPILTSIVFIVLATMYASENDDLPEFTQEYIFIIGMFIALAAIAIDAQAEKRRQLKYETAFAQLLFEIADAMRGGINPAKAIIEIGESDNGIFKHQLRIAAKNIKTGRPFEEVLMTIAKPTKNKVIIRYTSLIGEAAKIGGEIAVVIHRSAKDMDDLIKVKAERRRQMAIQIVTIYIAFGVLLAIVYLLTDMYPKFADIDLSVIFNFDLENLETTSAVKKMSFLELKRRFFHLTIINSIGSGLVIGKIIDGRMRFGLMHSLIMTVITVSVYLFVIL